MTPNLLFTQVFHDLTPYFDDFLWNFLFVFLDIIENSLGSEVDIVEEVKQFFSTNFSYNLFVVVREIFNKEGLKFLRSEIHQILKDSLPIKDIVLRVLHRK